MTTTVTDNPEASRYEIHVDGTRAGFAEYHRYGSLLAFTHTEIDAAFAGQGLGNELVRAALDDARAHEFEVEPFCPFVRAFISRHEEYRALVPADELPRFGLA